MGETVLKWFAAIIICLLLQTSLVPAVAIMGVQPDLPFIVLFFICIKHGILPGIYVGFFLGLYLDLFTPAHLGQNALANTVIGFFIGSFNEKIIRTDPLLKVIIIAVSFLIHDAIFSGVELLKSGNSLSLLFNDLLIHSLPRTGYTLIIISLVYLWNTNIKPNLKR